MSTSFNVNKADLEFILKQIHTLPSRRRRRTPKVTFWLLCCRRFSKPTA